MKKEKSKKGKDEEVNGQGGKEGCPGPTQEEYLIKWIWQKYSLHKLSKMVYCYNNNNNLSCNVVKTSTQPYKHNGTSILYKHVQQTACHVG